MSRTINELNTTATIVDADKLVLWQEQSGSTRAITAADAADYFSLAGGPYQPLDELLTSIAALGPSTTADRMIYTTAQDVAAVTPITAFGRSLVDDASASDALTTLGINQILTLSGTQPRLLLIETDAPTNQSHWRFQANASTLTLSTLDKDGLNPATVVSVTRSGTTVGTVDVSGTAFTHNTNTVWTSGNDGAGSGLDADLLDGVQASAFATLSGSTFTGAVSLSYATPVLRLIATSTNISSLELHNASRYDDIRNTTSGLEFRIDTSGTPKSMLFKTTGELILTDVGATSTLTAGYRGAPRNRQDANYTLVLGDAGKSIVAFGAGGHTWTIPANSSVAYPIGTVITLWNGATLAVSIAITTDTMYLSPGGTTGTRTLAQWGTARLLKVDSTLWTISGTGLT